MAYEPLHHKYRPATFADLVGQEAIASTLTSAIRQQRIAPAYLFSGPRGTGKTSSARILAKSLNCIASDRPTESPCGQCETCRSIVNGSAIDVIEIDAASNTGVDNIRELIERAQFAPVQCRYKVYAIDECHMLSTAAFNSLLKTLEEPPDRVVFVLATTDPQRVLPTIISRCQRFDYRRIRLDAMVAHLAKIAELEKIDASPEAITSISQLSQGGMRDAESLLDQLSLLDTRIEPEHVWDLVGAVPERDLLDLLRAIASDSPEAVLDRCREMLDRGREPLTVLQSLANFYRDFLVAKTAPDRQVLTSVTAATWPELCEFAQGWSVGHILEGGQHLRRSELQIKNTTQPRLWLEMSILGLLPSAIAARGGATVAPPRLAAAPSVPMPAPSPVASAPPSAASTSAPQSTPQSTPQPAPHSVPQPAPPPVAPTPLPAASTPTPPSISQPAPPIAASADPAPIAAADDLPDWDAIDPDLSSDLPATSAVEPPPASSPPAVPPAVAVPPVPPLVATAAPAASPVVAAPAPPPPAETPVFDLPHVWQQVLSQIQMRATRELLSQKCRLGQFDGQAAHIAVLNGALQSVVKRKQGDIETAFARVFDAPIAVAIDVAADAQQPAATIDPRQPQAIASLTSAPPAPTAAPPAPLPPVPPASTPTSTLVTPPAPISPTPIPAPTLSTPTQPAPPAQSYDPPASNPPASTPPAPTSPQSHNTTPQAPATQPSPPPVSTSSSGRQFDETEVKNITDQFANFFGGEVITLDEEVLD